MAIADYGRDRVCRTRVVKKQAWMAQGRPDGPPSETLRWRASGGELVYGQEMGLITRIRRALPAAVP